MLRGSIPQRRVVPDSFDFVEVLTCVCGEPVPSSGRTHERQFAWGPVRYVRCPTCRTWMQSPRISDESRRRWFDSEAYQAAGTTGDGAYLDYASDEDQRVQEARWRYRTDLADILPSRARILEVGCATGSFTSVLASAGHDVLGIDVSEEFVSMGRNLYPNSDLRAEDFVALEAPDGSFDAVIALGTAITLPNFRAFVHRCHGLLKIGGLLYFNVPLSDSWLARLYGASHSTVGPSTAVRLSRLGCRMALEAEGFEIRRERGDRQMPTVSKILSYLGLRSLFPAAQRLSISSLAAPMPLPALGVRVYWARRA